MCVENGQLDQGGGGGSLKDPQGPQLLGLIFLLSVAFQALCLLCEANSFCALVSHPAHK